MYALAFTALTHTLPRKAYPGSVTLAQTFLNHAELSPIS